MSELCMAESNEQRWTARDIIVNTLGMLTEIKNQVDVMESALYGVRVVNEDAEAPQEMLPILELLRRQNEFAVCILKTIVHIREGLW